MILKEGVYHLATTDLVSWWPFLCLSVVFYGLLPRLILLTTGLSFQRRRLDKVDFRHAACERLLHRMKTPLVRTEGGHEKSEGPLRDEVEDEREGYEAAVPEPEGRSVDGRVIVLVPDELFDDCPDRELEDMVSRSMGYPIRRKLRYGEDEEGDRNLLAEISHLKEGGDPIRIMIFQEAWQPPIREGLNFIRALRKALGSNSLIKVALLGRPDPDNIFTPVKEEDWEVWKRKLKAMGDPYLDIEKGVGHDA
jgi:hypothetical protein